METTVTAPSGKVYNYGSKYNNANRGPDLRRSSNKKGFQISQMWENHHEIARLILLGEKNVDIAAKMNCSAVLVSNVRNSPVVKEKLELMTMVRDAECIDLAREIQDLAPIAIQRVKEALTTGKVFEQTVSAVGILKEANNILDRQIGKPTQTINTHNIHGHFTMDDIDRIKKRAEYLATASGQVIEAE